jgi:hypothetical protein
MPRTHGWCYTRMRRLTELRCHHPTLTHTCAMLNCTHRVWTTHGTGARNKGSVWSPDVGAKKLMTRNRIRIVLGHFARGGLSGFGRKVCYHNCHMVFIIYLGCDVALRLRDSVKQDKASC